jgi:low temperature requirement protein LtrA
MNMMAAKNESNVDRLIRGAIGAVLLLAAFLWLSGILAWAAGIVGLVLLVTGVVGVCPGYMLMGFRTNQAQSEGAPKN